MYQLYCFPLASMINATTSPASTRERRLNEKQARDVLRQVIDPEEGPNIVAHGLVYSVEVAPGSLVNEITMILPACPMDDMICDVHAALAKVLPATIEADIRLIWEARNERHRRTRPGDPRQAQQRWPTLNRGSPSARRCHRSRAGLRRSEMTCELRQALAARGFVTDPCGLPGQMAFEKY
jgi:metal-sulfur cluster biosynthetic enzyme